MGLMILHCTDSACYEIFHRTLGLGGFFETTYKHFCIEVKKLLILFRDREKRGCFFFS
jgi:hypothetical protein